MDHLKENNNSDDKNTTEHGANSDLDFCNVTQERRLPRVSLSRCDTSMAVGRFSRPSESDSSVTSMETVSPGPSPQRAYLKRANSDDELTNPVDPKRGKAPKRGRGRPPTTGRYVGLARAKAEQEEARLDEMGRSVTREMEEERLASRTPTPSPCQQRPDPGKD